MDVNALSNDHLDEIAIRSEAERGAMVLRRVYSYLGRFIIYPSEAAHVAHTLWIAHTHLMDVWHSTPRIAFLSAEWGSGKSTALEVSHSLVPNPVPVTNVSTAYIFRKIGDEENRPTILFDEIDTVFGKNAGDHEDLRGLLNAGHRRGQFVGRCIVVGKKVETEDTPCFSAVALAGLGWLPDTLLSRSVVIRMRRRAPGEKSEPHRERVHAAEGNAIRDGLATWAQSIQAEAMELSRDVTWPALPEGIVGRDADVWYSLVAVADLAGAEWPQLGRKAAHALVSATKDREASLGVRLLGDIRSIFLPATGQHEDTLSTKTLLHRLQSIDEAPWADLRGKPLDSRGLAHRLSEYGIRSKNMRLPGGGVAKGYARADFDDAWLRYLTPEGPGATVDATDTCEPVPQLDSAEISPSICAHCGFPERVGREMVECAPVGAVVTVHRDCVEDYFLAQGGGRV